MATWNVGPFDNDDAVEWCDRLEETPTQQRAMLLERTLVDGVAHSSQLSDRAASEVAAAVATVVQLHTGVPDDTTPYAPKFLLEADSIIVTPELRELAKAALRVLMADNSSWHVGWAGHIEEEQAVEVLDQLRDALDRQS